MQLDLFLPPFYLPKGTTDAYNLFVLNPKRVWSDAFPGDGREEDLGEEVTYGYRSGFSEEERSVLHFRAALNHDQSPHPHAMHFLRMVLRKDADLLHWAEEWGNNALNVEKMFENGPCNK